MFYGWPSNFERNNLDVGGEQEVRVFFRLLSITTAFSQSDDDEQGTQQSVQTHLEVVQMIRKKAALTSQKAAGGMIKLFSSKCPAEYSVGSEVIVRRFSSKSRETAGRKRAGKTTRIITGTVLDKKLGNGIYKVRYLLADHEVEEWFGVSDLTAVTLEEENKKHSCVGIFLFLSFS